MTNPMLVDNQIPMQIYYEGLKHPFIKPGMLISIIPLFRTFRTFFKQYSHRVFTYYRTGRCDYKNAIK